MSTTPNRVRCHGTTSDQHRCDIPARVGSRYCGVHAKQQPERPVEYLGECASARYTYPVGRVHLRYLEHGAPLRLLCTSSLARPLGGPAPGAVMCPQCRAIAKRAVDRGEVEPDHLPRWRLGERNVDEPRP